MTEVEELSKGTLLVIFMNRLSKELIEEVRLFHLATLEEMIKEHRR